MKPVEPDTSLNLFTYNMPEFVAVIVLKDKDSGSVFQDLKTMQCYPGKYKTVDTPYFSYWVPKTGQKVVCVLDGSGYAQAIRMA